MQIIDSVFVHRLAEGDQLAYHGRYHSHSDDQFELHFFVQGEGSFLLNKTQYSISSNSLVLAGPHEFHSILPSQVTKAITFFAILFSVDNEKDKDVYQLLIDSISNKKSVLQLDSIHRFTFEEILRLSLSENKAFRISSVHLLLSHIYRWFMPSFDDKKSSISSINDKTLGNAKYSYVKKGISLMEKNVHKNLRIEDFALTLNISVEHFIRLFREEMEMTPYQYYLRLKSQEASALLITTDKTISEIAEEFAFENQFHFSRVFKKCTGLSPSAYKRFYSKT